MTDLGTRIVASRRQMAASPFAHDPCHVIAWIVYCNPMAVAKVREASERPIPSLLDEIRSKVLEHRPEPEVPAEMPPFFLPSVDNLEGVAALTRLLVERAVVQSCRSEDDLVAAVVLRKMKIMVTPSLLGVYTVSTVLNAYLFRESLRVVEQHRENCLRKLAVSRGPIGRELEAIRGTLTKYVEFCAAMPSSLETLGSLDSNKAYVRNMRKAFQTAYSKYVFMPTQKDIACWRRWVFKSMYHGLEVGDTVTVPPRKGQRGRLFGNISAKDHSWQRGPCVQVTMANGTTVTVEPDELELVVPKVFENRFANWAQAVNAFGTNTVRVGMLVMDGSIVWSIIDETRTMIVVSNTDNYVRKISVGSLLPLRLAFEDTAKQTQMREEFLRYIEQSLHHRHLDAFLAGSGVTAHDYYRLFPEGIGDRGPTPAQLDNEAPFIAWQREIVSWESKMSYMRGYLARLRGMEVAG